MANGPLRADHVGTLLRQWSTWRARIGPMFKGPALWSCASCAALVVQTALAAAGSVAPHEVGAPSVTGPITQSQTSYAFDAAAHSRTPFDPAVHGYVEEEYLLSGTAQVYDSSAPGQLATLASGSYVTRILVRRPLDPQRFNGAVIVEALNPSAMMDLDLMWMASHEYFMHEGYAWVGVTVKPVSVAALKRFDAARYAPLSLANPLPPPQRCADRELGGDTSSTVALAPDILSQTGVLMRAAAAGSPLAGLTVTRVYLTGYSQSAGFTRGYANAIAPLAHRAGGRPIYDGYVEAGHAPFNVPLNECAAPWRPDDARLMVQPTGVPFIDVASESDVLGTSFMRRADSDVAPDLFRHYEVAGATHNGAWIDRSLPTKEDVARAHGNAGGTADCEPALAPPSDFPLPAVFDAVWQNLDDWVVKHRPPPRSPWLTLLQSPRGLVAQKDAHGNAAGGVRTTALEVPIARWFAARGGAEYCSRIGYAEPFDAEMLAKLYPTHADYVHAIRQAVRKLRGERWLTQFDGDEILAAASSAGKP